MNLSFFNSGAVNFDAPYHEERVKIPLLVMLLAVALIAAPLIWWMSRINEEGTQGTTVSKYTALADIVNFDVGKVATMLEQDSSGLYVTANRKSPVVTLIVPEVVIVDESSGDEKGQKALNVSLEGIYWSPNNPLVGMNGETYRVGDEIQGYKIIKIGKTKVHFEGRDGQTVVKDFYENLFQSGK